MLVFFFLHMLYEVYILVSLQDMKKLRAKLKKNMYAWVAQKKRIRGNFDKKFFS